MAHTCLTCLCQTSMPTDFMIGDGSHVVSIELVSLLMTLSDSVTNIVLSLLQYYRKTCILSKCLYNISIKCYCPTFGQLSENIGAILCVCWVATAYNFAAGSFHTKKLCSRLFSTEVEFYWHKQRYRVIVPPFGGLRGNSNSLFRCLFSWYDVITCKSK